MVQRRFPAARPTQWFSANKDWTVLASGVQDKLDLYSASALGRANFAGSTLTRLIVDIGIRSNSVSQDNTLFWGILVVNQDAFSTAGALPDSDDMSDRPDYVMRGRMQNKQSSLSDASQWTMRHYDLRAQRILHSEEDVLALVVDNVSTGISVEYSTFIRALIKLP